MTELVEVTLPPKVKTVRWNALGGPAITAMAVDYGQPFEGFKVRNQWGEDLVVDEGWVSLDVIK